MLLDELPYAVCVSESELLVSTEEVIGGVGEDLEAYEGLCGVEELCEAWRAVEFAAVSDVAVVEVEDGSDEGGYVLCCEFGEENGSVARVVDVMFAEESLVLVGEVEDVLNTVTPEQTRLSEDA